MRPVQFLLPWLKTLFNLFLVTCSVKERQVGNSPVAIYWTSNYGLPCCKKMKCRNIWYLFYKFCSVDKVLFNNVYYAALWPSNIKKKKVLPAFRWIMSLTYEASYWNIWNYVLQIYGLAGDLCKKGCKIITCLKLSLFGVLLFGDFLCVLSKRCQLTVYIFKQVKLFC